MRLIYILALGVSLLLSCKTQNTDKGDAPSATKEVSDNAPDAEKKAELDKIYADAYATSNFDQRIGKLKEGEFKANKWGLAEEEEKFSFALLFADSADPQTAAKLYSWAEMNKKKDGSYDPVYKTLMQSILANFRRTPAGDNAANYLGGVEIMIDTLVQNLNMRTYDTKAKKYKPEVVDDFIKTTIAYAVGNPRNKQSPDVLLRGAEMARINMQYHRALELYDMTIMNFPRYEAMDKAYLLKGFLLENNLNKKKEAEKVYRELIEKYPNSDRAGDAKFLLQNINKSQAELKQMVDEFEK